MALLNDIPYNVLNIEYKEKNGYLDKSEVLMLLDEILIHQGRPKTTWK
jgi:hypothetical protein